MRRFRESALGLLELVMVMGLLAIVSTALFTFMGGSLFGLTRAEQTEQATSLARDLLEKIKTGKTPLQEGDFDGTVPTPVVDGFPPDPYPTASRGRQYWYKVRSTALDTRLQLLVVSVHDQDNRRVAQLETILRR